MDVCLSLPQTHTQTPAHSSTQEVSLTAAGMAGNVMVPANTRSGAHIFEAQAQKRQRKPRH